MYFIRTVALMAAAFALSMALPFDSDVAKHEPRDDLCFLKRGETGVEGSEADELCEYFSTPEERERLVAGYVRAHSRHIARLAGAPSLEDVEAPERFLDIREADRTDYFSWPEGEGSVTFLDEEGNPLSVEEWHERMERKAEALARGEGPPAGDLGRTS